MDGGAWWAAVYGVAQSLTQLKQLSSSSSSMRVTKLLGSKITADGDCSHEIKRCLLLGRKVMTNLGSILKSRDITLSTKVSLVKAIGEGNGIPLQYSCLENPLDGGYWWAALHGVTNSRTRLSDFPFTFHFHA